MTDPARPDSFPPEDRTRDITLPPLPDRPPPAMPKEWAGLQPPADAPTAKVPGPVAAPTAGPAPATAPPAAAPQAAPQADAPPESPPATRISREDAVARIEARMLASQRTDEMQQPPSSSRRDRTLAFSSPEMRQRPVEPVAVGRTSRRWPWVVLTLLPILVIVGAAVAWMLLLDGA